MSQVDLLAKKLEAVAEQSVTDQPATISNPIVDEKLPEASSSKALQSEGVDSNSVEASENVQSLQTPRLEYNEITDDTPTRSRSSSRSYNPVRPRTQELQRSHSSSSNRFIPEDDDDYWAQKLIPPTPSGFLANTSGMSRQNAGIENFEEIALRELLPPGLGVVLENMGGLPPGFFGNHEWGKEERLRQRRWKILHFFLVLVFLVIWYKLFALSYHPQNSHIIGRTPWRSFLILSSICVDDSIGESLEGPRYVYSNLVTLKWVLCSHFSIFFLPWKL